MDILKEKMIPLYVTLIKNGRKILEDIKDDEVKQQVKILLEEGSQNV